MLKRKATGISRTRKHVCRFEHRCEISVSDIGTSNLSNKQTRNTTRDMRFGHRCEISVSKQRDQASEHGWVAFNYNLLVEYSIGKECTYRLRLELCLSP